MQLMDSGELPTVRGRGRQGRLLREDVEVHAAARFRLRRYRRSDSYFVTTAGAAELLGVSGPRVIQLGDKGVPALPGCMQRLAAVPAPSDRGDRHGTTRPLVYE